MIGASFPIEKVSSVWRSHSIGYPGPDFLNLAVQVSSDFDLQYLKTNIIQSIEQSSGRIRESNKSAPRTIDIDVIVFHGVVVEKESGGSHLLLSQSQKFFLLFNPKESTNLLSSLAPKMLREMDEKASISFL